MSIGSFNVRIQQPHEVAIEAVTEALKAEGFGVLTRIDMHTAFAEKLGAEFRPYTILGACNPPLAHAAVTEAAEIGLLLPCNVTVEVDPNGGCLVRMIDPEAMMAVADIGGNEAIAAVGKEAAEKLRRVAAALS